MIRQDYILRLIEELGALLRAALGRPANAESIESISHEQGDELANLLEKRSQEAVGLSFEFLRKAHPEQLTQLFRSGGATWTSRCFFVARLFEYDAEISNQCFGVERARKSRLTALYLYQQIKDDPTLLDVYHIEERVAEVRRLLQKE